MTYQEFKKKWLGRRVDADGVYGYQCVDLIRQYMHELYGKPKGGAWGNAIDYWTHTNINVLDKFDRIPGTSAKQGDIVVFHGHSGNPYGHIGLVDAQNSSSIYTLEQNGSTGNGSGSGGDAIRLRWISKSRVAGLLRPKGVNEVANRTQVNNLYKLAFHRNGDEGGLNNYTGRDANLIVAEFLGSPEFKSQEQFMKTAKSQIAALQTALKNEQNKPPQIVEKEVEKIVHQIKEVEVPVEKEVVRIVKEPVTWESVKDFILRQARALLDKIKEKDGQ